MVEEGESQEGRVVMDAVAVRRAVIRIAHEIIERNRGTEDLALVGIRSRGDWLAQRLQAELMRLEDREVPCGAMDVTLYRDDLHRGADQAPVQITDITWEVDGRTILLVDDVLFTGRTVRAALDALMDFGRPRSIQLGVLVDRVENVRVQLEESEGRDEVAILAGPALERPGSRPGAGVAVGPGEG
jgi:pyrimidine operon attenuation protein/uracil phosphoribosyltransferase